MTGMQFESLLQLLDKTHQRVHEAKPLPLNPVKLRLPQLK